MHGPVRLSKLGSLTKIGPDSLGLGAESAHIFPAPILWVVGRHYLEKPTKVPVKGGNKPTHAVFDSELGAKCNLLDALFRNRVVLAIAALLIGFRASSTEGWE